METDTSGSPREAPASGPRPRRYGPRTCRICLDTEQPKYPENPLPGSRIFASSRPVYESDDPELGRLLSPCKCKGSQKYVHEGCLNSWRLADPTERRNYWQCPTCGFTYQTARLSWASMLTSELAQAALTAIVFMIGIFVLGFLADPVFNLWLDPVGTMLDTLSNLVADDESKVPVDLVERVSWGDHFLKGFFSLGLIELVKSWFSISPFYWYQHLTRRRQGNGRARVENISLLLVLIGAFTALLGTWRAVKRLSRSILKNVSDKVLDVGVDDEDGDDHGKE